MTVINATKAVMYLLPPYIYINIQLKITFKLD